MQEIALFMAPLVWLIAPVVAVTNRLKGSLKLNGLTTMIASMTVACGFVEIVGYFPVMPLWGKALVAALFLGLSASGVFDLFKLFGSTANTTINQG